MNGPLRKAALTARERVLVGLELFLAAGAYLGAAGLISGLIDLGPAERDLPWSSPVPAGIALGLVNGVLPTAVAVATLRGSARARPAHVGVGLALAGWIAVQVALIGLGSWLQVAYFVLGVVIALVGIPLAGPPRRSPAGSKAGPSALGSARRRP